MTLAAVKEIKKASVIAYPISHQGAEGMAATIASEWIGLEQKRLPLLFPMVEESLPRKQAWRQASDELAAEVLTGERVAFLCQGDVSLYASCSYLLLDLKARYPECPIRLVPGVTSISAAAAAGCWPLSLQQEQFLVTPTPGHPYQLEELLEDAARSRRVLALIKLGHRWKWVRPVLEKRHLLEGALFAQRVGWPDQKVLTASEVDESMKPYFSLLLIRQGWPDVIP